MGLTKLPAEDQPATWERDNEIADEEVPAPMLAMALLLDPSPPPSYHEPMPWIQPPEPGSHRYTQAEKDEILAFVDRWEGEQWSGGVLRHQRSSESEPRPFGSGSR